MQIRTPKKYQGRQQRSVLGCRRIIMSLLLMSLIAVGIGVYMNRDWIAPPIQDAFNELVQNVESGVATAQAPTATPTEDPTTKLVEADNFWRQGAVNEALDTYLQIVESAPNNFEIHDRIVLAMITLGRQTEALDYAERAINADPFASDAWAIRAWALDWNGRASEAISTALYALELNPDNARALAYLAEAYNSLGFTDRALSTIDRALEINPNSYEAYRARGLINWATLFDLDSALTDFETAYNLAPNMTFIAIDMANVELGRQNYQGAVDILEGVTETSPNNSLALYQLGNIYNRYLGEVPEAINYLQRCVDTNPSSIDCHYLLGRAQFREEFYSEATRNFERAVELGSQNPFHFWWAGNGQITLGNCNQAMVYFEEGFEIAQRGSNTDLVQDYRDRMAECSNFSPVPLDTPTPEPN